MKGKAVSVAVLFWSALLLCVLGAEENSDDDGIPKNEVSPLDYLYPPRIGM